MICFQGKFSPKESNDNNYSYGHNVLKMRNICFAILITTIATRALSYSDMGKRQVVVNKDD